MARARDVGRFREVRNKGPRSVAASWLLQLARLPVAVRAGARILDENPSCWTDGFFYERCCLGDAAAEGCWNPVEDDAASGIAGVPHSYERCCRSPCGAPLRARIASSRGCGNKRRSESTVVTGLWNLQRHTWAAHARYKEGEERAYGRYLEWLDTLLVKEQAMLLFVDREAAAFAARQRQRRNLTHLTCILEVPREDLPQYRWRDAYEAAHEENRRQLPNESQPEVVYADYTLTVNSKPELLACASQWDPFRSSVFAWVDAGAGRKEGFPAGSSLLVPPPCGPWRLCVGRRMWLFFDFRDKIRRLQYGSTFDSTVLVGGAEGVRLYALWFQWAIARYLEERVMDDEQSVIAEVWWTGHFGIQSFYGMTWVETLGQLLGQADHDLPPPDEREATFAEKMGHWFGETPYLIWRNEGRIWVPFAENLGLVERVVVKDLSDEHLERIAFGLWCQNAKYDYYAQFCDGYRRPQIELPTYVTDGLPVVSPGAKLLSEEEYEQQFGSLPLPGQFLPCGSPGLGARETCHRIGDL